MTKYTGNGLVVTYGGNTVPSGYLKSADTDEDASTSEATGIGDVAEIHLPASNVTKASLDMWDDSSDAVLYDFFVPGTTDVLIIHPQGTAPGTPKLTCANAIVTGRKQGAAHRDTMPLLATFDCSGGLTDGTNS